MSIYLGFVVDSCRGHRLFQNDPSSGDITGVERGAQRRHLTVDGDVTREALE